jgi:hypothetical protein
MKVNMKHTLPGLLIAIHNHSVPGLVDVTLFCQFFCQPDYFPNKLIMFRLQII